MRLLALVAAGVPVLMLSWSAWSRLYAAVRADHKEALALRLAKEWPPFARSYALVRDLGAKLPANAPWTRPEHGSRAVYILRGGRV